MEPYICVNGDYFFLIDNEEVKKLKSSPLESSLLFEGEEDIGKKGRLVLEPNGGEELMLKRYPENSSCWEDIEVIELVLNQEGYERLQYGGLVKMGGLAINCYVKDILRPNILE